MRYVPVPSAIKNVKHLFPQGIPVISDFPDVSVGMERERISCLVVDRDRLNDQQVSCLIDVLSVNFQPWRLDDILREIDNKLVIPTYWGFQVWEQFHS